MTLNLLSILPRGCSYLKRTPKGPPVSSAQLAFGYYYDLCYSSKFSEYEQNFSAASPESSSKSNTLVNIARCPPLYVRANYEADMLGKRSALNLPIDDRYKLARKLGTHQHLLFHRSRNQDRPPNVDLLLRLGPVFRSLLHMIRGEPSQHESSHTEIYPST